MWLHMAIMNTSSKLQTTLRNMTIIAVAGLTASRILAMRILVLAWLLGMPRLVFAQTVVQEAVCNDATRSTVVRVCENGCFERVVAGLNAAYRNSVTGLDQVGREKLRTVQKAWIRSSDAEAAYQADAVRDGAPAPLIETTVRADLMEARRRALEKAAEAPGNRLNRT